MPDFAEFDDEWEQVRQFGDPLRLPDHFAGELQGTLRIIEKRTQSTAICRLLRTQFMHFVLAAANLNPAPTSRLSLLLGEMDELEHQLEIDEHRGPDQIGHHIEEVVLKAVQDFVDRYQAFND